MNFRSISKPTIIRLNGSIISTTTVKNPLNRRITLIIINFCPSRVYLTPEAIFIDIPPTALYLTCNKIFNNFHKLHMHLKSPLPIWISTINNKDSQTNHKIPNYWQQEQAMPVTIFKQASNLNLEAWLIYYKYNLKIKAQAKYGVSEHVNSWNYVQILPM